MSIIKKQPGHFILLIFQLAYNYFKMFSWFLLYNTTNQLYVYIYPLLHGPLSHPPSRHFRSPLYSTVLCSSFPLALCFTPGSAYIGGACGLQFMGSLGVGHDRVTSLSLFTFMHWRRKWQPTPVFLPGKSQRRRSLVGYHLWGHTASDTTQAT